MRALFLDFDGVLHPLVSDTYSSDEPVVHAVLFGWLPRLASVLRDHPDVGIVVHSTWRRTHNLEELRELLGPLGSRVLGVAPEGARHASITAWLAQNPRITDYRILDDDCVEFPEPPPAELIRCHPGRGLTEDRVLLALKEWLGA